MFYCYILKSIKSSRYYIGSTADLNSRLQLHNSGSVKSTKTDKPWGVLYFEKFINYTDARKRELQIKRWKSRKAIEVLTKTFRI